MKKYIQKPKVVVGKTIKEMLDSIGNKGDTYEDIIIRLIKFWKLNKK